MNFIEAIIAISKRPDMELCDDETELDGRYPSICVYKDFSCIGKLDWPRDGKPARVDKEVITELKNKHYKMYDKIKNTGNSIYLFNEYQFEKMIGLSIIGKYKTIISEYKESVKV